MVSSTLSKKLQPLDICVYVNTGKSVWDEIQRWALGDPYTHVFMYLGIEAIEGRKVIYESVGRGVILSSPAAYFGHEIVAVRPRVTPAQRYQVIQECLNIACDVDAYYDYVGYGEAGLSLVLQKLHLPVPFKYHRDKVYICSEAVAEPFWRNRIPILPQDRIPLPGDFIWSPLCLDIRISIFGQNWL